MERIMENNTIIEPGKTLTGKPHFMKTGKIFLVLDVCVLYAMQAFVFFPFYGILNQKNYGDFNWPVIGIFLVLSFVIGLLAFVFAIIGSVNGEGPLTIFTVAVKIAMIPFFGINLYLWLMLISGLLNPFLMLSIPFVAIIGVCLTYVYMLTTGLPDIIYTIIFCFRHKRRPTLFMVIGVILCFIFVADIAGSIMLHKTYKDIITTA